MSNKVQVPKLRFKGFEDEWEKESLTTIASITMGQSPHSVNYTDNPQDEILVQGNADLDNGKVKPRIYTTQVTKESEKGDVILTVRAPVGEVAINNFPKVVLGRGVAGIKGNRFVYTYLEKLFLQNYWSKVSSGSTFQAINSNDLKLLEVTHPKDVNEQQKIGEFFAKLDKLIALYTQKIVLIKKYNWGIICNLIPEKNDIPDIRFKDFHAPFITYRMNNITDLITKGTTPREKNIKGSVNFIKVEDIDTLSGHVHPKSTITRYEHENYLKRSKLKVNDILFSIAGTLGKVTVVDESILPANTNQAVSIIRLKNNIDINYIRGSLKSNAVKKYILQNPTVGAQPNLSLQQVSNLILKVPSFSEQQKIGFLFKKLDQETKLYKQKIEKLKQLKKAYLQKMFC